jgi:hypothetical protein
MEDKVKFVGIVVLLFLSAIYGTKTIQEGSSGTCLCYGVKHTAPLINLRLQ